MAKDVIVIPENFPALLQEEQKIGRELARQIKHMERIRQVTEAAIDEESKLAQYSAFKATNTLLLADLLKQAAKAQGISLAEPGIVERLTQQYLNALNDLFHSASGKIVFTVNRLPVEPKDGGLLDDLLDGLFGS